jgi:omega-amidase
MHVAAVQFDIVWEDKAANHAMVQGMISDLAPPLSPQSFVLLPELGDTGFSMNLDRIVDDQSLAWATQLAKNVPAFVQHGFARREATRGQSPKPLPQGRNCAAIISPQGEMLGEYQKIHPFSYGKESQFYFGGDHLAIVTCGQARICPLICYDLRFPELWRLAAQAGAEVFTIGASWPAARQHHWRALLIARAIENQAYVVAVNRVGRDPHLDYVGGSIIVSPRGEVIAEADDQPTVLRADLDLGALREWRAEFPALRDIKRPLLGEIPVKSAG